MKTWASPLQHLYDADRPEPYFALSSKGGYVQPENVLRAVEPIYARLAAEAGGPVAVLDLGCGYGAFGALARRFGTMAALYEAAAAGRLAEPASWPARDGPLAAAPIVGVDVAARALRFAEAAGFVDRAVPEDLTRGAASPEAREAIRPCRLVVEAGAAYPAVADCLPALLDVFDAGEEPAILLGPRGDTPMDAAFAHLRERGYEARRLTDAPLRFRRFLDAAEREAELGREPGPEEIVTPSDSEGYRTHLWLFEPGGRS